MADNPFFEAISGSPAPPPPEQLPADNPFFAAVDPAAAKQGRFLAEAQNKNLSWDQFSSGLVEAGGDPSQFQQFKSQFDLNAERRRVAGKGESTLQVFRRKYMPFSDVIGTNFLPNTPGFINRVSRFLGGPNLTGGRVVGEKEYADATNRFRAGEATDDDLNAIATHEGGKALDASAAKNVKVLGSHFAGKLALELGGLGKIAVEMTLGGAALGKVPGSAGRFLRGDRVAAAAIPGAAPAIPQAASLLRQGLPALAAKTAVAPSMYMPMIQQNNVRNGRDPNSFKGVPTAFAYGMANMAVLGRLQTRLEGSLNPIRALSNGLLGMAELQGVDLAAGALDQFLPKAFQIHGDDERWGTVGSITRAYNTGDREKIKDAWEHAAVQALSFAAFGVMHSAVEGKPAKQIDSTSQALLKSYMNGVGTLRSVGYTKAEAGAELKKLHDKLEDKLSDEPYLSRESAKEFLIKEAPPGLKSYASKLADVFEPQVRQVEKPPEPVAPEPAPTAETPKAPEPTTPAPEAAKPEPNFDKAGRPLSALIPGESKADYAKRLKDAGMSEKTAAPLIDGWLPESPTKPPVAAAAAPPTPTPVLPKHAPPPELVADGNLAIKTRDRDLASTVMESADELSPAQAINLVGALLPQLPTPKNKKSALKALSDFFTTHLAAAATPPKVSETPTVPPVDSKAPSVPVVAKSPEPVVPVKPPEIVKPQPSQETPEDRTARMMGSIVKSRDGVTIARYDSNVDASNLTPEAKAEHKARFRELLTSLPPAARADVHNHLKRVVPHESLQSLTVLVHEKLLAESNNRFVTEALKLDIDDAKSGDLAVGGWYNHATGELHVDGGGRTGKKGTPADTGKYALPEHATAEGILGHETGHIVDGPRSKYSGDPQWREAAKEINGDPDLQAPLSEYSRTDPHESWAEFYRLVHKSDVGHATIAREFPLATQFMKDKGQWPEKERPEKAELPLPEAFNEKVPLKDGHADAWDKTKSPEPVSVAAAATAAATPIGTAVASVFGSRMVDLRTTGSRFEGYQIDYPDRYMTLVPDGKNRVVIGFDYSKEPASPEESLASVTNIPGQLQAGTLTIFKDLRKLVSELHKSGIEIEYSAEGKRHAAYSKLLQNGGYEQVEERTASRGDPGPTYVWRPKAMDKPFDPKSDPLRAVTEAAAKITDPVIRDYLESARDNFKTSAEKPVREMLDKIGSSLSAAYKNSKPEAIKALEKLAIELGGEIITSGPVKFDGRYHISDNPLFTGNEAIVTRPGIRLPEGERDYVALKAQAEPVAAAATPKMTVRAGDAPRPKNKPTPEETGALLREQFESMDLADMSFVMSDPDLKAIYEEAGVPVQALYNFKRLHQKKLAGTAEGVGATRKKGGELEWFDEIVKSSDLSEFESATVRGISRGWSLERVGKQFEKTKQAANKAGRRAVKKISTAVLSKVRSEATGDPERMKALDEIEFRISELDESIKSTTLEQLIRTMAGMESAGRLEAQKDRGVVEGDPDDKGRIKTGDSDIAMFGGKTLRLDAVANFLSRNVGGERGIGRRLYNWFTGGLPPEARAAKQEEIERQVSAYAQDIVSTTRDLRRAVPEYDNLTKEQNETLKLAAEGDVAAAAKLTPEARAVMSSIRKQVDALSGLLKLSGAIPADLIPTFDANEGVYLKRGYQIFDPVLGPKWANNVPIEIKNRWQSLLRSEMKDELAGKSAAAIEKILEAETRRILVDGTAAENPIRFLATYKTLGGKDLSILKERKELPPELRALFGEHTDILSSYVQTVSSQVRLLTAQNFLTRIAREGEGKFLFDRKNLDQFLLKFPDSNPVQIAEPSSSALSPLNGKYTTQEYKQAFADAFSKNNLSEPMRAYMKAVSLAKLSKVVLSHVGQIRNFASNILTMVRNGYWRAGNLPESFRLIGTDTPEAREKWRQLITLGVVGEGLTHRDFVESFRDVYSGRELSGEKGLSGMAKSVYRILSGGRRLAERMYGHGDAFFKIFAFENERADYKKAYPDWTDRQLDLKAAELTRSMNHTYAEVPEGVKKLRRAPLLAPFISFQAETIRTVKNTIVTAFKELQDPATRGIGAKRLAGLAAAASLPLAMMAAFRAFNGITADEEKAVRRLLPDYQKESQLLFTGRGPNGPKYVDFSKIEPHAYLTDAVSAVFRADSPMKAVQNAGDELAKPFISEELLVRPALDVARNKKEPGGQVYNTSDTFSNRSLDVGKQLADPFIPGAVPPIRRLLMGLTGSTEQKSGASYDPYESLQENLTSNRVYEVRVEQEIANKARGFQQTTGDAARITNSLIRSNGTVSEQELAAAATRTDAGRQKAFEEFAKDVAAAESLGVSRQRLRKILRDSGVSSEEIGGLLRGVAPVYHPEVQGTPQERQRALQLRGGR